MNLVGTLGPAIITGAAQGIGRAISMLAAQEGAELVLVDVQAPSPDGTSSSGAVFLQGDVRTRQTWEIAVGVCQERFGRIAAVIHNAGGSAGRTGRAIEEVPEDEWDAVIELNLRSAFLCARAVAPIMKQAGYGRIVFVGSNTIRTGTLSGLQAYPAAKAGLSGFARQLAYELGPHGITVNVVAPGFTISSARVADEWAARPVGERAARLQQIPLKRLGQPEDIAPIVLFFASERSRYVTGQTIFVDGGYAAS